MKLSDRPLGSSRQVLLFGPPKSGKTQLAGECAEEFNLIWIDMENGVDTLKKLPLEWQERIEVISLPDTRSYPIAIETCLKLVKGWPVSICETHGKINCPLCRKNNLAFISVEFNKLDHNTIVVWDSGTQLTNSAISNITKDQPDDYKLQLDDWGNLGKLMDIFYSHIQNASWHNIVITHETSVEMVDGKDKIVPTAGSSNFSRNFAKYFGEVAYIQVKNGKHRAGSSTAYANSILTGSRTGTVLEVQEKPSLIPIFKGEAIVASTNGTTNATKVPTKESTATDKTTGTSQGQKAVSSLQGLAQRLAAKGTLTP